MKKAKRYNGEDDSVTSSDDKDYGGSSGSGDYAPEPAKPSNFKSAFAAARAAGDKTFEFGGKKYTTELASSKPSASTSTSTSTSSTTQTSKSEPKVGRAGQATGVSSGPSFQDRQAMEYLQKKKEAGTSSFGTSQRSRKYATGMAKGGSASSRADGIATKGKTRGKMC